MAALTLVCALSLAATGCGSSDSGSDSAAPTATVRRSPATTAAPATTTTTAAPGHEDFTAILRDLLARRDEAYEKNDVSILEEIYSTQCECLANGRRAVERQKAEGIHAAGARLKLLRTELVNRLSPTYAIVRGIVEQPAFNFVNADGAVVRPGETHGPLAAIYELGLEGTTWHVLGITTEGPVAG